MSLPNRDLIGRVALITGAARGIGLAMAQAFAAAGCAVAIQDIDFAAADLEVSRLKEKGQRALALGGDISDTSIVDSLIDQTVRSLGGLHIVVNNASIQFKKRWTELTVEDVDKILHANVVVPMLLSQRAAAIFKAQRWGRIINIGSIQQMEGNPVMLPYSMSKAALVNQTTALAKDLGHDGITVNLIAPGYFDTLRNVPNFKDEEDKARVTAGYPVPRLGRPEDCAGMALVLASDAGAYITGQSIHIDGGIAL